MGRFVHVGKFDAIERSRVIPLARCATTPAFMVGLVQLGVLAYAATGVVVPSSATPPPSPTVASPTPAAEPPGAERERAFGWGVGTGVVSALAFGGMAAVLWGRQRGKAFDAAAQELADQQSGINECFNDTDPACDVPISYSYDPPPRTAVTRQAFMIWPFTLAAAGVSLAAVSGHRLGLARPRPGGQNLVLAGSFTVIAGAASFLVGRLRRPDQFEREYVARWFDTSASLYTHGAVAMGVGAALISYGQTSSRADVKPQVAIGRDRAVIGLSLRF